MTHSPGTHAHWPMPHWHCAPEPHCRCRRPSCIPGCRSSARARRSRRRCSPSRRRSRPSSGRTCRRRARCRDCRARRSSSSASHAGREGRRDSREPRPPPPPPPPPPPARSAVPGTPPSKSNGCVRQPASADTSSNSANRRGMRESYDKCLTAPYARFMVLNKCPVCSSRSNFSVAVTRKVAEEVERHKAPDGRGGISRRVGAGGQSAPDAEVPGLDRRGARRWSRRRMPSRGGAPSADRGQGGRAGRLPVAAKAERAVGRRRGAASAGGAAARRRRADGRARLRKGRARLPPACHGRAGQRGARLGGESVEERRAPRIRARSQRSSFTKAGPARPAPNTSRARASRWGTRRKDEGRQRSEKTNIASRTGRDAAIELAVTGIEKQFGKGSIMRLGDDEKPPEVQVDPDGLAGARHRARRRRPAAAGASSRSTGRSRRARRR